jgi:hypothetical protein
MNTITYCGEHNPSLKRVNNIIRGRIIKGTNMRKLRTTQIKSNTIPKKEIPMGVAFLGGTT